MSTSVSTTQLNLRIISIVVFTCICYLSIGLPLAVLPGYIHYQLGYSTFVAGIVISLQYISTLISRPHAGRYTDIWGPKKVVIGIGRLPARWRLHAAAVGLRLTPMLAGHRAAKRAGCFSASAKLYRHRRHLWDQNRRPDPRHGLSPGTAWRPMWRWRSGRRWSYPQSLFDTASAALLRW